MAIPANTIDEVLAELDRIIETSQTENNYLGVFAFVYRRTTAQIQQVIRDKGFEDNERMELMDVFFANLYLTAYQNYEGNLKCSESWETAFGAKTAKISILQHLLLSMNAHINLDLAIAAATFSPGLSLSALKNDFMKVNQILNNLTNEMQDRISRVSPLMFILDWLGKNTDEKIANFSMVKAREQAWKLANVLANKNESEQETVTEAADQTIAAFGKLIKSPPEKLLNLALKLISKFEEKDVRTIISKLREDKG